MPNPETQEESEGFMTDVQYYLDPTHINVVILTWFKIR